MTYACCQSALRNFKANASLALGMTTLPAFVFWTATEWMKCSQRAAFEIVGKDLNPVEIQKKANQVGSLAERYMAEAMNIGRDQQVQHLVETTTMFEAFSVGAGKYAQDVLNSLLKTIIVQSWTAFEVLTEDLCNSAIRERPSRFIHAPANRKFRSRRSFKKTYRDTFNSDNTDILSTLDGSHIEALALLRNVLVHNSGIVDQDFLDGSNGAELFSAFNNLHVGDPILLDGPTTQAILDPVFKSGYDLVLAVDKWLIQH